MLFDETTRKHIIICGHTGHYYLARHSNSRTFGVSVRFAGGVFFKDGMIVHWNNRSGHYQPAETQAAKEIGKIIGFPIEKFMDQFEVEKRVRKLGKKISNYQYAAEDKDLIDLTGGDKAVFHSFKREFGHKIYDKHGNLAVEQL